MRKTMLSLVGAISALALLSGTAAFADGVADPLAIMKFQSKTKMDVSEAEIQETWNALEALGATRYVGGTISGFQLDEATLVAGGLAVGVTEFDNFLHTGKLTGSTAGLADKMAAAMSAARGSDLSYLTGRQSAVPIKADATAPTSTTTTSTTTSPVGTVLGLLTGTALTSANASLAGQCSPQVAAQQVAVGIAGVNNVVNAAMTPGMGFSPNATVGASTTPGTTTTTGFAARSCLENLFMNTGMSTLFQPPSLGSLASTIQSWSCSAFPSIATQVAMPFGDFSGLNTTANGGFFPQSAYGDANQAPWQTQLGVGNVLQMVFGTTFAETTTASNSSLSTLGSIF